MRNKVLLLILLVICIDGYAQELTLHYESAQFNLSNNQKKQLDSLSRELKDAEEKLQVVITGHTDSIGNFSFNKNLSQQRANVVRTYLQSKQVKADYLVESKSYSDPVALNQSEAGKAKNRRVNIKIVLHKEKVQLQVPVQEFVLHSQKKNVLTTANGCKITVLPNSLLLNGMELDDTVRFEITEYNDPVDFLAGSIPMSYNEKEKTFAFHSEQMMKIAAYKDTVEVKLKDHSYLILNCDKIDTAGGLKFYEFKMPRKKWEEVKKVKGKVEQIEEKPELVNKELDLPAAEIKKENNSATEKSTETSSGILTQTIASSGTDSNTPQELNTTIETAELKIDTGSIRRKDEFLLIPDTGSLRRNKDDLYVDYADLISQSIQWRACDHLDLFVEAGLAFSKTGIPVPEYKPNTFAIPKTFYERYCSFDFDGIDPKSDSTPSYTVRIKWKKRFLHKQFRFQITEFPKNPEYEFLKDVQWTFKYFNDRSKALEIVNSSVSDFKISNSGQNYYLELKTKNTFYKFEIFTKTKLGLLRGAFLKYQKARDERIKDLNSRLRMYIKEQSISDYFYMRYFLDGIFASRSCNGSPCVSKCGDYPYSTDHLTWRDHFNSHLPEMEALFNEIKANKAKFQQCICGCSYKWQYNKPCGGANDLSEIYVGFGIYNFDVLFELTDKQKIKNPDFKLPNGQKVSPEIMYSILPGINGLLYHETPSLLSLVPKKINIIYFTDINGHHYKTIIDLLKNETPDVGPLIVKDITDKAKNIESLKKELLRLN
ncbi:MAG: OmpA family protein [Flavobacteriales bacterium]